MGFAAPCLQELGTLPIAPIEEGTWWWAQARLGYTTLGVRLSVEGVRSWKVVLSRCTDKSPWYPITVMNWLLNELPMERITQVQLWADAGTHFRARQMIWWAAYDIFQKFPKVVRCSLEYFAESHGKGPVDGLLGRLSRIKALARTHRYI